MKPIGISQRVEYIESYNERRDCLDQAWTTLTLQMGLLPFPLPTLAPDPTLLFTRFELQGLILTGGNDLGQDIHRDEFETGCVQTCIDRGWPILGVCRGMQLLNQYFGGSLKGVDGHRAVRHELKSDWPLAPNEVNSFHAFTIDRLGNCLEPLAYSADGEVEAIKHSTLPIWAIMWHPERENRLSNKDREIFLEVFG